MADLDIIELAVLVEGELRDLDIPIPIGYDGWAVDALVRADLEVTDCEGADGAMSADAFDAWEERAASLHAIEWNDTRLARLGIQPGAMPGLRDAVTGEPSLEALDATIEVDLRNWAIVVDEDVAGFRAMREACGASRAALAGALDVDEAAVEGWEASDTPLPPQMARDLVTCWYEDALDGARWHVRRAEQLRKVFHEAYVLVIYRDQEEFDRALAPLLAQAPESDCELVESGYYTNLPGTRAYWRANAAARLAAALMEERRIPFGFAYLDEEWLCGDHLGIWVPRVDTDRVELTSGPLVVCGLR